MYLRHVVECVWQINAFYLSWIWNDENLDYIKNGEEEIYLREKGDISCEVVLFVR